MRSRSRSAGSGWIFRISEPRARTTFFRPVFIFTIFGENHLEAPPTMTSQNAEKLRILGAVATNKVAIIVVNPHFFVTESGEKSQRVADLATSVFAPKMRRNFNVHAGFARSRK